MGDNKYYSPLLGVKQGCPVAALCFILLYRIIVTVLEKNEIDTVSFVDDATRVIDYEDEAQNALDISCTTLQRMGMAVNNKIKLYGFHHTHSHNPPSIDITMPMTSSISAGWLVIDPGNQMGTLNTLVP